MKKISILYLLTLTIILVGCSPKEKRIDKVEAVIAINPAEIKDNIDLTPIFNESFDIIKLETTDECILADIQKIIYGDGYYFISDAVSQNVKLFDSTGKFIRNIGNQGQGPEEFVKLGDFFIKDGHVFIQDPPRSWILVYTINNEFVKRISTETRIFADELIPFSDHIYYVNNYVVSKAGNNRFFKLNLNNNNIEGLFPFDPEMADSAWGQRNFSSKYKDRAYVLFSMDGLIFDVTEKGIRPKYEIKFSGKQLSKDLISKTNAADVLEYALKNDYIWGLNNINVIDKYLFSSYTNNRTSTSVLIDTEDLSVKQGKWFLISGLGNLLIDNYTTTDNGDFLVIAQAYDYIDTWNKFYSKNKFYSEEDRNIMQQLANNLNEEDNPVIFRFTLKQDSEL